MKDIALREYVRKEVKTLIRTVDSLKLPSSDSRSEILSGLESF